MTCLQVACAAGPSTVDETPPSGERGYPTPEAAVQAFTDAWNASDRGGVLRTFHPPRRAIVGAALADGDDVAMWRITSHRVDRMCHPRGAYWKTAVVGRELREGSAGAAETIWLRLEDGGWWLYAL